MVEQAFLFLTGHWVDIVAVICGGVTLFSVIAKLTPTEVDDKWAARLLKLVDLLAINTKPTTKSGESGRVGAGALVALVAVGLLLLVAGATGCGGSAYDVVMQAEGAEQAVGVADLSLDAYVVLHESYQSVYPVLGDEDRAWARENVASVLDGLKKGVVALAHAAAAWKTASELEGITDTTALSEAYAALAEDVSTIMTQAEGLLADMEARQ